MIKNSIIIIFLIILIFKILMSIKNIESLKYIFTPLTTLTIIALPIYYLYNVKSPYAVLITSALIFSLIGDIFNMLQNEDQTSLQYGLIFFIFAQIIYIYTFLKNYSFYYSQLIIILIIIGVLISTFFLFRNNFKTPLIKFGIGPYMIAVSTTMIIAIGNLYTKIEIRSILITIGTCLFWLSDLILGVDVFYKKLKLKSLYVWGLYAPGQLLIALSCYY